jgi:tetrahydromethanopterin S-methyltransferase subunit G
MWRSKSTQDQINTVQTAIKDLDKSMLKVRGEVGQRIDGKY